MIIASHQIDLMPYFGFFNRMKNVDIFDLGGHYDVWRKGKGIFQHRVKIGYDDKFWWITMPVIKADTQDDIRLKREEVPQLFNKIYEAYHFCPNFDIYKSDLKDKFNNPPEYLWQFNLDLILWIRDKLCIDTPISISQSTKGIVNENGGSKILKQLLCYGTDIVYYSGAGGMDYIDVDLYKANGVDVIFQDTSKIKMPEGYRTVSILSAMMDFDIADVYNMIGGIEIHE